MNEVEAALERMRELAGDSERWPIIERHIEALTAENERLGELMQEAFDRVLDQVEDGISFGDIHDRVQRELEAQS